MLAPLRQILELLAGFYNRAVTLQSEKFMNGISGASRKMRNTRTKCEMLYSQRLAHSGQARATHRHTVQKGCVFKVTYAVVFQPLKACHMHWVDQKTAVSFDKMSADQPLGGLGNIPSAKQFFRPCVDKGIMPFGSYSRH